MGITRTSWFLPAFSLALGIVFMAAMWIGGQPWLGVSSLGIMAALAAILLFGGRSETIRGLRGDGRDEYWARLDLHATAIAGLVAITAILVMCAWEWGHGRDGSPYTQLGAIAGVSYVLALVALRVRS
jgi:hypothetical protein